MCSAVLSRYCTACVRLTAYSRHSRNPVDRATSFTCAHSYACELRGRYECTIAWRSRQGVRAVGNEFELAFARLMVTRPRFRRYRRKTRSIVYARVEFLSIIQWLCNLRDWFYRCLLFSRMYYTVQKTRCYIAVFISINDRQRHLVDIISDHHNLVISVPIHNDDHILTLRFVRRNTLRNTNTQSLQTRPGPLRISIHIPPCTWCGRRDPDE